MRKGVGRDFAIAFAGQAAASLQALIVLPLMIRLAGEANYGAFVLITSFAVIVLGLLGSLTSYRYRRGLVSASGEDERRQLFEPQFTFQVLALVVLSGCVALAATDLRMLFFGGAQFAAYLLVAVLAAQFILRQVQDYFKYTRRFLPGSVVLAGRPLVFLAVLAVAAWLARGLSLDTLLILQVAATLGVSLPFLPTMIREIGRARPRLPLSRLVDDARMGFPLAAELMIDFVLGFGDRYLIVLFMTVADVGRYQPGYALGSLIIALVALADTVLVPTLARLIDLDQQAKAEELFAGFLRLFLMVAIPFAVGALMIGPSLIAMLTNQEIGLASRWVVPLVAVGTLFYGIMRLASLIAYVLGRTRIILGANLLGAALNLALNLALLPIFRDITVAAAATMASYAVGAAYAALALRSAWPMGIDRIAVLRFCAAGAAMAGLLWFLGYRPGAPLAGTILTLSAAILAAIIGYFLALSAFGGFGRREIAQIAALMRQRHSAEDALD
jgi:O-antigen/teichoic acid export membrane protein